MSAAVAEIDRVEELLQGDARLSGDAVTRSHALVVTVWRVPVAPNGRTQEPSASSSRRPRSGIAGASCWRPSPTGSPNGTALLVLVGRPAAAGIADAVHRGLGERHRGRRRPRDLYLAAHRAFELLEAKARAEARGRWLRRYRYELGELLRHRARDDHRARRRQAARRHPREEPLRHRRRRGQHLHRRGAALGALERARRKVLRFKLTQNDSVTFDSREFTMPLSDRSIAGSAALNKTALHIPDVYDLPKGSTFHFDPSFDRRTGYVTRSMLVAPLISQRDEVIGVIQLINKKRDPSQKLLTEGDVDSQVVAFDERSEELLGMLSAQAGVSLETAILYEEIRKIFEGFVNASVEAIESRDPTTSGHSRRVAELTVALAKVVDGETSGPYAGASFKPEDLRELEYASLLHDFGKIGVREKVLVKAKKLYEERLELMRVRFDYVARSIEADVLARKVRLLETGGAREALDALDASSPSGAPTSTARGRRSAAPTSRRCCRAATSRRSRRSPGRPSSICAAR